MVHSIWNPEPLPRKNCRQPIISPQFSLKLHENEGNWTKRGASLASSLNPSMATNKTLQWLTMRPPHGHV